MGKIINIKEITMKFFLSALIITFLPIFCMAETVILKDGTRFEAVKITEDGNRLAIQTKYGNILADKTDVENLEALGFASKSLSSGPKTNGLEFISGLAEDLSLKVEYFFNKEMIGTQLFSQSGKLLFSDGKIIDGNYKEFYFDGKLKKEKTLINGQDNGSFKIFYPDGTIQSEAYFINGKMNGGYKAYSDSGKLITEKNFMNGIANGYFREFDESGALKSQTRYINGEPEELATPIPQIELSQEVESKPLPGYKPVQEDLNLGRIGKKNAFFIEAEIFTVGGADKEWEKNINAFKDVLNSVYDSVTGDLSTFPGLGITVGVNMAAYKKSPCYLAASYVKGPSADMNINTSDSYYASAEYDSELTTSFYRLLLGYKLVIPMQSNEFFVVDANAGFGGGSINEEWTISESGYSPTSGSSSESWTGFTWSIGPTFSWESRGCVFELGGRYTVFPELTNGDKFSDVKWKPFSIKASIMF